MILEYPLAILAIITNALEYYIQVMFFNQYLEKKKMGIAKILYFCIFVSFLFLVNQMQVPFLNGLTTFFLTFINTNLIFSGSIAKKFAFSSMFVAMSALGEMLCTFLFSILSSVPINKTIMESYTYIFTGIAGKMILYLIIRFIIHKYPQRYPIESEKDIFILALFPTTAVITMFIIIDYDRRLQLPKLQHMLTVFLLISYLFISIIIFFLYHSAIRRKEFENKIKIDAELRSMNEQLFKQQQNEVDALNGVKHEFKRHLSNIYDFQLSGKYDKLSEYCSDIISEFDKIDQAEKLIDFNNFTISNIYARFISNCCLMGIKFDSDIRYIDFSFLRDIDAAAIFSNLLDNAVEACTKTHDSWIKLHIYRVNNYVVVKMSNSKCHRIIENNSILLSTRRNYISKGYGIQNVLEATESYSGYMTYSYTETSFCVLVRLMIPSEDA